MKLTFDFWWGGEQVINQTEERGIEQTELLPHVLKLSCHTVRQGRKTRRVNEEVDGHAETHPKWCPFWRGKKSQRHGEKPDKGHKCNEVGESTYRLQKNVKSSPIFSNHLCDTCGKIWKTTFPGHSCSCSSPSRRTILYDLPIWLHHESVQHCTAQKRACFCLIFCRYLFFVSHRSYREHETRIASSARVNEKSRLLSSCITSFQPLMWWYHVSSLLLLSLQALLSLELSNIQQLGAHNACW